MRRFRLANFATVAAILLAVAFPWITGRFPESSYLMVVALDALLYALLALGLNIVVGYAGLLVLGFIAFYAVGAYSWAFLGKGDQAPFWCMFATVAAAVAAISVVIHLRSRGLAKSAGWLAAILVGYLLFLRVGNALGMGRGMAMPFWLALPLAGIAAALFGLLLGLPTLRLRGDYLAIVTLGFGEIVQLTLKNLSDVTGGPNGVLAIPRPQPPVIAGYSIDSDPWIYSLVLGVVLLAVFVTKRLADSRIGRAWVAMREDEIAATAMGIDTFRMKLMAFAIGAGIAGVAGVFFAAAKGTIAPDSFSFLESVLVLCMVVLGGMGSIPGVILGALVLTALPEAIRFLGGKLQDSGAFANTPTWVQTVMQPLLNPAEWRLLIFGAAIIVVMVFRPQGLVGSTRRKLEMRTALPEEELREA